MFEYGKDTIERILKLENFNVEDIDDIKHVPMHEYRVSDNEKTKLLIENLQVCISLFAYSKNFAFAAHINPVVLRGDEIECDSNKKIISSRRVDDLFKEIKATNIKDTLYIGISIGFNPIDKTYELINVLNDSIDKLVIELNKTGIETIKLEPLNNHVFLIDSKNNEIIVPNNDIKKGVIK